jgi:hypothetical protein
MSKHTPGRWEAKPNSVVAPCDVRGFTSICLLIGGHKTGEEVRANARLIAAAPELLEALRDMVSDHAELSEATLAFARAAIAKAQGADA